MVASAEAEFLEKLILNSAAGNSDGDFQMLEWTTAGSGPRFGLIVHHTDGEREYHYDRESGIGKLARCSQPWLDHREYEERMEGDLPDRQVTASRNP